MYESEKSKFGFILRTVFPTGENLSKLEPPTYANTLFCQIRLALASRYTWNRTHKL